MYKENFLVFGQETVPTGLCHEYINPAGPIIFCLGRDGGPFDRRSDGVFDKCLPFTALPALRPGLDIAIIPTGEASLEVAGFYQEILGLESWQIQFAPGAFYTLETCVCGDMEEEIRNYAKGVSAVLLPYNKHEAAEWLADRLGVPLYGDSWRWRKQYGKIALHPHINSNKCTGIVLERVPGLRIPTGFIADTSDELETAFFTLRKQGLRNFVLKPAFSDAGEGIVYLTSKDIQRITDYSFNLGPVILEQRIDLAYDPEIRCPISPSIHWAGKFHGLPTSQLVERGEYQGTCYPARLSEKLAQQAQAMVRAYVDFAKPAGLGGIDFIASKEGDLYLCDVNNGRCTEAIPPLLFAAQYKGANDTAVMLARKYVPDCSLRAMWDKLQALRIAWSPGQEGTAYGVFPLMHLDGVSGMLTAFAPNMTESRALLTQAMED